MTREEAIEEINKVFEPAFANYIITALTEGATISDKASEQEPVLDKIRSEIEYHRRKVQLIDPYDLVGDCLDIIDKYRKEQK